MIEELQFRKLEYGQPLMRVLYLIFVLCVGALLWAAIAAARHIRRHEKRTDRHDEMRPAAELPDQKEVLWTARNTDRR